jgi:hypothetical protein
MIAQSLQSAKLALSSVQLTVAAMATYILFGFSMSSNSVLSEDVAAGLLVPILIGLLVITYLMSRRAGDPSADEIGSVGRWMGWGILAGIPVLLLVLGYAAIIGFDDWIEAQSPFWLESLIYLIGAMVAMPLYALSTGRAINGGGS